MVALPEGWMRQIDRSKKGTSIALFDAAVQLLLLLPWGQLTRSMHWMGRVRPSATDGMEWNGWMDVMMLLYAGLR